MKSWVALSRPNKGYLPFATKVLDSLVYLAGRQLEAFGAPRDDEHLLSDAEPAEAKSVINGMATTFVGNYYELSGSTRTSYNYTGSSRIAMRTGSNV